MKACSTCICRPISFPLDLTKISPDKKLPFIERVLGLLIESRFANGHAVNLAKLSQPRDVVPAACFDLHPRPMWLPLRSPAESVKDAVSASLQICRERIARIVDVLICGPFSKSPSTLGRGSPRRGTGEQDARPPVGTLTTIPRRAEKLCFSGSYL